MAILPLNNMNCITKFLYNASARQLALLFILFACLGANSGCFYYKSVGHDRVATKPKKFCRKLRSSLNPDKYVIVHEGNNSWHLRNMVIDLPNRKRCAPDFNVLYGSLEDVDSLCAFYYDKYREKHRRAIRYLVADEDYVISQVHVYLANDSSFSTNSLSIPVSSINRIEVYNQATGRTSWSWAAVNILIDIIFSHHSSPKHAPDVHQPKMQHGPRGNKVRR